jgi:hypothetical protein
MELLDLKVVRDQAMLKVYQILIAILGEVRV